MNVDLVLVIHHLYHRTPIDEESGQVHRFDQAPAAIAAQIQHHRIHVLGLEILQDFSHIGRGTAGLRRAVLQGLHVQVETRQIHDTHLHRRPIGLGSHFKDLPVGRFVFQFDLGPSDFVGDRFVRAGGNHVQADDRVRIAANQLDNVIELHAHDVDHLGRVLLADGNNLVILLQLAVFLRGTAGNDLGHHRLAVLVLKLSTDPFQLQLQGDPEIFQGRG